MMQKSSTSAFAVLGGFIVIGLTLLGYWIYSAAIDYKMYERSVTVKGLSQREFTADIVIWPIQFTVAENDLTALYTTIDQHSEKIQAYLEKNNIPAHEITIAAPSITDKSAQQYADAQRAEFRYTAIQTITVYSKKIDTVRGIMGSLSQLGKQGIVFTGQDYQSQTEYLFTRLNDVKPEMIEEATTMAREVAQKFAKDSQSSLGKIRRASQGQFSITSRDRNNPHIKQVRVVSTVEYYLSD